MNDPLEKKINKIFFARFRTLVKQTNSRQQIIRVEIVRKNFSEYTSLYKSNDWFLYDGNINR